MMAQATGFVTHNSENPQIPILLSVPHAGRDYPPSLFENLRISPAHLLRLEDRYADILARAAVAAAVPTIIAVRARAWIDLNRSEDDIDTAMVDGLDAADYPAAGAKQRGGLGLIPRRLAGAGEIWKSRLTASDLGARISEYHRPYHAMIAKRLTAMRARFGTALLLDLHSMPPLDAGTGHGTDHGRAENPPQFVVGDRFGRSAAGHFSDLTLSYFREQGYAASLNYPYAGDYILRRHADPRRNIHALQLEVDRSLYLDAELREAAPRAAHIGAMIAELIDRLAHAAAGDAMPVAAQ